MTDIVRELRGGNLSVSGEARHINALLDLHRRAAAEIERLRKALHAIDAMSVEGDAASAGRRACGIARTVLEVPKPEPTSGGCDCCHDGVAAYWHPFTGTVKAPCPRGCRPKQSTR